MPDAVTWLRAHEYRRERWRNQQGWTREILRVPDADCFHWRASIAEINQNTLFSPYPDHQRAQVLMHGAGLRLGFTDGHRVRLDPTHRKAFFDGADIAACQLLDGPVHVFNAIWDPVQIDLQLLHRPLVGPMVFFPNAGVQWLIHQIAGQARITGDAQGELDSGDSLWLRHADGARLVLEGSGELLLLRLTAAGTGTGAASHLRLLPKADEDPET